MRHCARRSFRRWSNLPATPRLTLPSLSLGLSYLCPKLADMPVVAFVVVSPRSETKNNRARHQ